MNRCNGRAQPHSLLRAEQPPRHGDPRHMDYAASKAGSRPLAQG